MVFFDFFKSKNKSSKLSTDEDVKETKPIQKTKHSFDWFSVPNNYNGIPVAYSYKVSTSNVALDIYEKIEESGIFDLSVEKEEDRIVLYWESFYFAEIKATHYVEIISDFLKKNEPIKAYASSKESVFIQLFRDKTQKLKNKSFDVILLTSYKGSEKQEEISYLTENDDFEIDEETAEVLHSGTPIGKVPKSTLKRINQEGLYACFFDHYDYFYDDETGKETYVPYIRIYW